MTKLEERILIYIALAILCCTISVFLGAAAGIYTFMQIAAVIEFIYWFGTSHRLRSVRRFQII